MKRRALVIAGVLVGMSYCQYTRVASLVGSKTKTLGPAAYRAAAKSAAVSVLGNRVFARPISSTTSVQPSSLARLKSILQPKPLTVQSQKSLLTPVSQSPLAGSIRNRMIQSRGTGMLGGVRYASWMPVKSRVRWIPPADKWSDDIKEELNKGDASESESLHITGPMLDRIGISREKVKFIEYDGFNGWADTQGNANDGYTYTVRHPRIITGDGEIDPFAISMAAHELMHVKYNDVVNELAQIEEWKARKAAGENIDIAKELAQYRKKYEERADKMAAWYFPELDIAYHLGGHFHRCFTLRGGKFAEIINENLYNMSFRHPRESVRAGYLGDIAREDALRRQEQERLKMYGPITELESIRRGHPRIKSLPYLDQPSWKGRFGDISSYFWENSAKPQVKPTLPSDW